MDTQPQSRLQHFETGAYAIAFLLAFGLRFFRLGELPLGDLEAANALQALNIARGSSVTVGGQPGYVLLTSILFFVFGHTEFWARFWPAAFGVGLVFTPLLFKRWLGVRPAAILALFLAIEPGFTTLSRTATGTMIAVTSLLLAAGFLLNRKSVAAGIFSGVALLGGVSIWPGILAVLISLGLYRLLRAKIGGEDLFTAAEKQSIDWKSYLLALGGTLLILGTLFVIQPKTISGLGTSLADYFISWAQTGTGVTVIVMLLALIGEQLLAVLLAFFGAIGKGKDHQNLSLMFGIWAIVALALALLNPSRQVVDWCWTLLPLWAFAAFGLDGLLDMFLPESYLLRIFQTFITFALLIFSSLNLLSLVMGTQNVVAIKGNYIISILLPLILLILITILIGWGWSVEAARDGFLLGIGLVLIAITFGTAIKAMGIGPRPEAELWRSDALPVGEQVLMKTVGDLSLWNTQQPNGIDVVLLNQEQPSLQWAFRDFSAARQSTIIGENESPSLVISAPTFTLTLQQTYRGQGLVWSAAPNWNAMTASDWAKWFTFRKVPLTNTSVLLWARNDLFKD